MLSQDITKMKKKTWVEESKSTINHQHKCMLKKGTFRIMCVRWSGKEKSNKNVNNASKTYVCAKMNEVRSIENKAIIQNKSHLINTVNGCLSSIALLFHSSFALLPLFIYFSWCDRIYVNVGEWVIWPILLQYKMHLLFLRPSLFHFCCALLSLPFQ